MNTEKTTFRNSQKADSGKRTTGDYVKTGLTVFLTFACCIMLFFLLYRFSEFKSLFGKLLSSAESVIIGLVLAYLLNPVMEIVNDFSMKIFAKRIKNEEKRKKLSKFLGVFGAILFLGLLLTFLIAAIVPALLDSIRSLVETLPGYVDRFVTAFQDDEFGNAQVKEYISNLLTTVTDRLEEFTTTELLPQIQTYIAQITTGVIAVARSMINFIIGIIVAIYVMMSQETMIGQSKKILYAVMKPEKANLVLEVLRETDKMFGGFIRGKLVDSLIIGVVCYIGCLILGMPNTFLIAVVIGVTNIIPFFGPFIGAIPSILLVLVQNPVKALYLMIFILLLQQVDGNIIGPRILGNSTGLSSFWVMVAILIGGGMFGFLGMLLGVPVMGVLQYLVRRITTHLLKKRQLLYSTEEYYRTESIDKETGQIRYTQTTTASAEEAEEKKVTEEH